jgi:ferrochelatase
MAFQRLFPPTQQARDCMAQREPRFGFVAYAETLNGRMAMLGFLIGLATEVITGQSILAQIGIR